MRKILLFTVLLGLVVFAAPAYAPPPSKDVIVVNEPGVNVVNDSSNPVPVEGSVDVTNQVQVTGDVEINNTELNPVPVRVANETTFQPWREMFDLELEAGQTSRMVPFPAIPAGKRLVIESVTAQLLVKTTQIPYIQLIIDGVYYYMALSNIGSYTPGQYVWMATHDLKLYADNYGTVRILRAGGTDITLFASLSLSGYLVDLP